MKWIVAILTVLTFGAFPNVFGGDQGWAGSWQPRVVDDDTLTYLRDMAGSAQQSDTGEVFRWCQVDLQSGEFEYPATGRFQ